MKEKKMKIFYCYERIIECYERCYKNNKIINKIENIWQIDKKKQANKQINLMYFILVLYSQTNSKINTVQKHFKIFHLSGETCMHILRTPFKNAHKYTKNGVSLR